MTDPIRQATLLGGEWVGSETDEWVEDTDPADTRQVLARLPKLSAGQVARALDRAGQALPEWAGVSGIDRGRVLLIAAGLIRYRVEEIAADISRESGKLMAEARGEVLKSADFLEYYAGMGRAREGDVLPDERAGTFTYTMREPLGVVAMITAWNDPMLTPARKLGPALIAGNAAAIKPAEDTPLAALHLARALDDAGLPPGIVNVVVGHPEDVAAPLLDHPAIRAVSFTGSTATGSTLRARLARRNLRFQAEMGGKNAAVVTAGADLESAAATISAAAYAQAGQRCTATSRVIAETSIADELTDALIARAASIVVGPGVAESSDMGPLISERQLERVVTAIDHGVAEGAALLQGGRRPSAESVAHGCFLEPALMAVESPESAPWREEIFGPVLTLGRVRSVDEAIDRVNDSPYGLSASIFTNDLEVAMQFARRVDTGQVAVNRPTSGWDVHLPFGGFKESGSLSKEQGVEGLDFYTRVKTVAVGFRG